MRRHRSPRPAAGVTLIEALLFSVLGLVLIAIAVGLQTRSFRIFDTATRTTGLVSDARRVFEGLVRGLRYACIVTEPLSRVQWDRDRRLVYYRFASGDTRRRLQKNLAQPSGRDYPFSADSSDETVQVIDCVREIWTLEPGAGVLRQEEAGGLLKRTATSGEDSTYDFQPDASIAPETKRLAASHVQVFEVTPLALVVDPQGPHGQRLAAAHADGTAARPSEISLVALALRLEDRPADRPKSADEGVLELTTKVWIDQRAMAFRFPGFFSSLDDDLEF